MQKGKPLNGMVTQQRGLSTARRVGAALPQHVGVFAGLFGAYLPDAQAKDFCEMEIASAGIVRGFMAVPCGRGEGILFLDSSLKLYDIPMEKRQASLRCGASTSKMARTRRFAVCAP